PRDVVLSVTAVNRGHRELWTALRNRQISFDVRGPDGPRACPQKLGTAAIARDWFHRLAPDQKGTLALLAAEVCPPETFERPGLYEVAPTLHPDDAAREHGMHAYLEDAKVDKPTLVRIRHGRKPYHKGPPVAQPLPDTPRPGVYDAEPEPASSPLPSGAP
ncbi:MAG: hypothetical protein HY908_00575, partial [Myxococcales bacterium]|nr:hypothetical protein [Myxococcales bacterium]